MKKVLIVGDAACPSGFAKGTHAVADGLHADYDVTVLGINYNGDPHAYPYPIYAAAVGGDAFGVDRLVFMCDLVKSSRRIGARREIVENAEACSGPDLIIVQQDGWNVPFYVQKLAHSEYKNVPLVAVVAVDGKNFDGSWLDGVSLAIFWTQFALDEARRGGYTGPAEVIPLGVDRNIYRPLNKQEARRRRKIEMLSEMFIVGNVNRNQPRKRWDLSVKYFAEWVYNRMPVSQRNPENRVINDAFLYFHTAPTGDVGFNVRKLARYYGVVDRLALLIPHVFYGSTEEEMRDTYCCFDADMSTTQGEGFGLTTIEAMACGIPCAVPEWSALADWARGGVAYVPCTSTAVGAPYVNVIGGVPDEDAYVETLNRLYLDRTYRERVASDGFALASQECFRWESIQSRYLEVVNQMVKPVLEFARG